MPEGATSWAHPGAPLHFQCAAQFFEGFAIGSAVVDSGLGVMKSMLAGAIYSVTTPLGIAVGE